jgi:hypothetical protein
MFVDIIWISTVLMCRISEQFDKLHGQLQVWKIGMRQIVRCDGFLSATNWFP